MAAAMSNEYVDRCWMEGKTEAAHPNCTAAQEETQNHQNHLQCSECAAILLVQTSSLAREAAHAATMLSDVATNALETEMLLQAPQRCEYALPQMQKKYHSPAALCKTGAECQYIQRMA
jgi:hypothetical protein